MKRPRLLHVLLLGSLAACTTVRPGRFADRPIVREVADDRPIPLPEKRLTTPVSYAEALGTRGFVDALNPVRVPRAGDVNALDEVPHSSWYADPAGGPLGAVKNQLAGVPEPPLTLLQRLPESGRGGVVVIDARGLRYELARDVADRPYLRTSAGVIATRLVRALGYRAPEVSVIKLREADLVPVGVGGQRAPLEAMRAFLDEGAPAVDGIYRATATRWPVGIDVGPTPPHGVRGDDDNDLVYHEDRRTFRALKLVRAWLSFPFFGVDTLRDVYVGAPGKGHVEHFVVSLDGALGADVSRSGRQEPRAHDPTPDPTEGHDPLHQLFTFGLGSRQSDSRPGYPRIGAFDETVTDGDYDANLVFAPTYRMTAADGYWIAKRIALVGDDAIRAAVDAADIPDARTRDRLVQILSGRRDAVVARAFGPVTPAEVQSVDKDAIVIKDLGYTRRAPASFEVNYADDEGRTIAPSREVRPNAGVFSMPYPRAPYLVVRARVTRGAVRAPRAVEIHLRAHGDEMHLVGVRH